MERAKRLVTLLLLVGWLLPGLGALGVGLHLAIGHHHDPDTPHVRHIAEMVQVIDHGHGHDGDAIPDHRHEALIGSIPAISSSIKMTAVLPAIESIERVEIRMAPSTIQLPDGPPAALFATHCSLLL